MNFYYVFYLILISMIFFLLLLVKVELVGECCCCDGLSFFLVVDPLLILSTDNVTVNVMRVVDRLIFSTHNTTIPRKVQPL